MRRLIYILPALVLAACSDSNEGPGSADPVKPQKRYMEEQFQALDKAKSLEKTLQDGAEQQRKAMEEQGG